MREKTEMAKSGKENKILIESRIDSAVFARFALYDMFILRRKWKRPAAFLALMAAFSAICYIFRNGHDNAQVLAAVLLGVGIAVPAAYILSFLISARDQASKLHLNRLNVQYSVELSDSGVRVSNDRENAHFNWKQILCAVRRRDCIYLYATAKNAYLLPKSDDFDAAWTLISKKMPGRIRPDKQ